MILAKADRRRCSDVRRACDAPGGAAPLAADRRGVRAVAYGCCCGLSGRDRLLDGLPVLQRSIELRNPYVDSLSELQVRLLARLRRLPDDDPQRPVLLRLVQLAVNGVAAGVQNTG